VILYLNDNKVTSVSGVIWPSSLEVLYLYNNALTSNGLLNVTWPGNLWALYLDGNADTLTCVPMSQGWPRSYWGPDPCEWTVWACEGDDYSTDIDPGSEAGCCKYEGSFNGAALVRTGSCPGFTGELHLDEKGITLINPESRAYLA
jgi:Leucine-rich repeat (LRR) protein